MPDTTIMINAVTITPNSVNTGDQIKIVVDVKFLQPPTILFDRRPFDVSVWSPE